MDFIPTVFTSNWKLYKPTNTRRPALEKSCTAAFRSLPKHLLSTCDECSGVPCMVLFHGFFFFFFFVIIKQNLIQVPTESDELVNNLKTIRPLYRWREGWPQTDKQSLQQACRPPAPIYADWILQSSVTQLLSPLSNLLLAWLLTPSCARTSSPLRMEGNTGNQSEWASNLFGSSTVVVL